MPIKINFNTVNMPDNPTFVLAYKDGRKIGNIIAEKINVKDSMNNPSEISFSTRKYINNKKNELWDSITNFKLIWYKEADLWFEITVDIDESNEVIKNISGIQLGQAELSQFMLYNIEINTEEDIARDDYVKPTVLYNEENPDISLLNRIMEKVEHYSIEHVDGTIKNIQRSFSFDDTSIYNAFEEISEEIDCLFYFDSSSDENGNINRKISVYDLESNCNECGYRGEFTLVCPKCGSKNINEGYGKDTTIFVTADELGDDIQLSTDTDSVKNCFKLEAGDDLMTATIRNCNPNGSDYIWYISDYMKNDMSTELVSKLTEYDDLYNEYQNNYIFNIDESVLNKYNSLIEKYSIYNEELQYLPSPIVGYPALMNAYYNTIDFSTYLTSVLMPNVEMQDTNASEQILLLTSDNLSPVSVTNLDTISLVTANNAVLSIAKIIIDSRYKIDINESSLSDNIWTGNFEVSNYSDEEDTAISNDVSISIDDDYENFIKQKLNKAMAKDDVEDVSISGLFKLEYDSFCEELKKYCLNMLNSFYNSCQSCIDILIEQGVSDESTWIDSDKNLYNELYVPYYNKLNAISNEIDVRQSEIDSIIGVYDENDNLITDGTQTIINSEKQKIQDSLNFKNFIGSDLWKEFCLFRREDKYYNDNYISDGLSNSELFNNSLEFIEKAKIEIYKSSELQHSISSNLKNLLIINKFKPILEYFEVGNWIRILIDDKVYKLRLLEYSIDFENNDTLSVEFSDVLKTSDGESDQKSIISKIQSMTTSYSSVQRQASKGSKSNDIINNWNEQGLDITNTKIIGGADEQTQTWDSHGMLFRRYNSIINDYDDVQLKIINSTIAITTDKWNTTQTAIGNFYYNDPVTGELKNCYGVNGRTILGELLIGKNLGIYNESGTLTFDENGFIVKNEKNTITINPNNSSVFNIKNNSGNILSFNEDGDLIIIGDITAKSLTLLDGAEINSGSISGLSDVAISGDYNDLINTPQLFNIPINESSSVEGQYLSKSSEGSEWKNIETSIDENGMSAICGKAVYDFSLSKNQGTENSGKLLYINNEGIVSNISIDELKILLGIEESGV